jgi:hypothetical protein
MNFEDEANVLIAGHGVAPARCTMWDPSSEPLADGAYHCEQCGGTWVQHLRFNPGQPGTRWMPDKATRLDVHLMRARVALGPSIRELTEDYEKSDSNPVPKPYVAPDTSRVPINIDPNVRAALIEHLNTAYAGQGVGYSEFIRRALTWDQAIHVPEKVIPDTRAFDERGTHEEK